jgi:hypothetical protein
LGTGMNGETLARVLRSLATAVERMTPMELEALPKQLAALRSVGDSFAGNARRPRPKAEKLDYGEVERLLSELRNAVSREQGYELLERFDLSRRELTTLARRGSVHVTKNDDISRIREKLVESLIGARLSSIAIRGRIV